MEKKVILIVEDDPTVGESLRQLLKKRGYGILLASNGKEALHLFRQEVVDLVITDLVMPKMDGLALLKEIKARDPRVIFLMITGYPTIETTVEAMKAGAYDYLPKPFHLEDVSLRVERAMEKWRMQKSLRTARGLVWGLILSLPFWLIIGVLIAIFWR